MHECVETFLFRRCQLIDRRTLFRCAERRMNGRPKTDGRFSSSRFRSALIAGRTTGSSSLKIGLWRSDSRIWSRVSRAAYYLSCMYLICWELVWHTLLIKNVESAGEAIDSACRRPSFKTFWQGIMQRHEWVSSTFRHDTPKPAKVNPNTRVVNSRYEGFWNGMVLETTEIEFDRRICKILSKITLSCKSVLFEPNEEVVTFQSIIIEKYVRIFMG